jgi:sphingomyelin phosphodiesterase acid-like 3
MHSRGIRLLGLILVFMSLLQITACSSGSNGTTIAQNNFPVLVFSDVHFNPYYDPSLFPALNSSDVGQWASIFQTSKITAPSVWGTDTNYPLLVLTLSAMRQNLETSPFIIFTGDILGHYLPQTYYQLAGSSNPPSVEDVAAMKAFTNKAVTFFMNQVRMSVGNVPVLFALGNADSYTGLGPDSTFLTNTAELYYTQFLNGTVDHQAFLTTFVSGGYYSAEPPGTNLMIIGLNTFEFSPPNPYMGDASAAVTAQLAWLDSTLASAQGKGKKVWLLMHVPPGADKYSTAQAMDSNGHITATTTTMMWNQNYQANFLQILSKYPGLVVQTLAAHTHMDEYRIMAPDAALDITPGISPYFGNNPAFKVFTFSSDSLKALNYTSLNYDLATNPEQFNSYYTFSSAYSMNGLLNDSFAQLYPALATDHTKQVFFRGHYFSGHNYSIPVANAFNPITDRNWPIYWCGIGNVGEQEFIDCVNSF